MDDNKNSELKNILDQSILVFYTKKNKKDIEKNFCKFIHFDNEKNKLSNDEITATILEAANKKLNNSNTVNKIKKIKKHKIKYYEIEYE